MGIKLNSVTWAFQEKHHTFTSFLKCRGQWEEVGIEESQVGVFHMITDDRDHPAAGELQVIPLGNNMRSVSPL